MISLKVDGASQFARMVRELSLKDEKAIVRKMLRDAAEPIREEAERLVPISDDAPHLVDHIVVSSTNRDAEGQRVEDDSHVVAVGPSKDLFYAFFQEFGTVHHRAQPFMRPAFDSKVGVAVKVFQERIWAFLRDKASRSTSSRSGL